jgi:catechol 2,3-dioxygenase-like lactoylglutathione lyase family enzyme
LELNLYPEGSRYGLPYVAGEGLDHIAFKVDDVKKTYAMLVSKGAATTEIDPPAYSGWSAYVKDPDGNGSTKNVAITRRPSCTLRSPG